MKPLKEFNHTKIINTGPEIGFHRRALSSNNQITTLNDEQKQVLIGTLLGDGHLETRNDGKTYRFKFAQSNLHKAYLFHVYHVFRNLTLTAPKQKANGMWYFNTISSACFRPYAEQFYGSEKGVPQLIDQWLTPKVLAYWYLDDGSMKSKQSKGVLFNTHSFTLSDIERLCEILQSKFELKA